MSIITECTENHFLSFSFISQVPLCTRRGSPLQRQGFNKQREATHQMSALCLVHFLVPLVGAGL